jgi:hypothetical protein
MILFLTARGSLASDGTGSYLRKAVSFLAHQCPICTPTSNSNASFVVEGRHYLEPQADHTPRISSP